MKQFATKKVLVPCALGFLAFGGLALTGCALTTSSGTTGTTSLAADDGSTSLTSTSNTTVSYTSAPSDATSAEYTPSEGEVAIVLADGASSCASSNVVVDNAANLITIKAVGTYVLSGSLSEGTIYISAEATSSEDTVELILNGVSISNSGKHTLSVNGTTIAPGPIYSANSAKLDIKCLKDSASVVKDSRASSLSVGDDSAAIFSNKKLQIKGAGSLAVTATYQNGIASDSKIEAAKSTLAVTGYSHALKAHNSIILGGAEDLGSFTLKATASDATCVRVDEVDTVTTPVYGNAETDDEIAGIEIKDGAYVISSADNALSSEAYLYMEGGNGTISSTAGKGIRSALNLFVDGGSFSVKTPKDDCIHSTSGSISCSGGSYTLTTGTTQGCQGIKANTKLIMTGGSFNVTASYEGISAPVMDIRGGVTSVVSTDDGWNAGGTGSQTDKNCSLTISGGTHYVYAGGDGLDSNGYFYIKGGTTVVAAPSSGGNGPLDSGDGCEITVSGGNILAYGVSGMTESLAGTQNSVVLASHTSFASGNYYVIVQGSNQWAVKANRTTSTFVASLADFSSGSVAIYEASKVTISSTLSEIGSFYSISAYTSTSTLYSGSFSAASSSHLQSGSSSGGGGNPGGGPGR